MHNHSSGVDNQEETEALMSRRLLRRIPSAGRTL